MVEFSNNIANESDLASSYTESGYGAESISDPKQAAMESANAMIQSGVNVDNVTKISSANDKVQTPSPMLKKKKILKKLFLQYIKKYISNPKKYIDHPKQIRNLPSWFDDAIVLFNDSELTRDQKMMIREFFTGLIRWRDDRIARGEEGQNEVTRQLGERSPYNMDESPDDVMLPRENDVQKLDIMGIARNVAAQNIMQSQQPTMEEYVESDIPIEDTITSGASGNVGGMKISRPSNSFSINDYIMPMGRRASAPPSIQPAPQPIIPQPILQPQVQQPIQRSSILAASTQATSFKPTSIPIGNMNIDLTSFIMGGRNKSQPISNLQPIQTQVQPTIQYRNDKKTKPKLNRNKIELKGLIPRGVLVNNISLKDVMRKSKSTKSNSIIKGISLKNIMGKNNKIKLPKQKSVKSNKLSVGTLDTVKNMDKVFSQVKKHSNTSYSPGNMKMKIVSDIKNQCNNAFKTNKFKTESINIKKNFMKDMKNSLPMIRMEMQAMGDIHERNVMDESVKGIPKMLQVEASSPFMVKRGSMRPKSIGITEYDFDLGDIYKKKRKSQPVEEEFYYEE